jgi:hypothetical protein
MTGSRLSRRGRGGCPRLSDQLSELRFHLFPLGGDAGEAVRQVGAPLQVDIRVASGLVLAKLLEHEGVEHGRQPAGARPTRCAVPNRARHARATDSIHSSVDLQPTTDSTAGKLDADDAARIISATLRATLSAPGATVPTVNP